MMFITFVIPAFNAQRTISCTIDSILSQTDQCYKIILVNDGSTDCTPLICEKYQKEYSDKITYISQENRGLGGARNTGLKFVQSEYVAFLDSDDWLMPQYVETLRYHIDTGGKPEVILTLPKIYDENSRLVSDWYDKQLFRKIFRLDGQIVNPQMDTRLLSTDVSQCRKVMKYEYIGRINFCFREKTKWEDIYPHFYLMSQCRSCMGIGSVGFYYRKGSSNQITASVGAERLDLLTAYEDIINYMRRADTVLSEKMIKAMYYPVSRIMISFALESIRMSDISTRKLLVARFRCFFRTLPSVYFRELKKHLIKDCTCSEARNFAMMMLLIKNRWTSRFYNSYFYQECIETVVKRIVRRDKANRWR